MLYRGFVLLSSFIDASLKLHYVSMSIFPQQRCPLARLLVTMPVRTAQLFFKRLCFMPFEGTVRFWMQKSADPAQVHAYAAVVFI